MYKDWGFSWWLNDTQMILRDQDKQKWKRCKRRSKQVFLNLPKECSFISSHNKSTTYILVNGSSISRVHPIRPNTWRQIVKETKTKSIFFKKVTNNRFYYKALLNTQFSLVNCCRPLLWTTSFVEGIKIVKLLISLVSSRVLSRITYSKPVNIDTQLKGSLYSKRLYWIRQKSFLWSGTWNTYLNIKKVNIACFQWGLILT